MKRLIWITFAAIALLLVGQNTAFASPSNYQEDWVPAMNQTSYWAPWECTKYDGHGGWIPGQYDAAIIKGGTKVRVYPDLTNVGGFQAVGPDNPNSGKPYGISWVMKCKVPVPPSTTTTTVPVTTTTSTSLPTTTTLPPSTSTTSTTTSTTSPPTTVVESTTTTTEVQPSTTTTAPSTTTSVPSPSTTQAPSSSTTTAPSTSQPTTTTVVAVTTPPTPPTTESVPTTDQPKPEEQELPATGSGVLWMLAIGGILVGSGLLARRTASGEPSPS